MKGITYVLCSFTYHNKIFVAAEKRQIPLVSEIEIQCGCLFPNEETSIDFQASDVRI